MQHQKCAVTNCQERSEKPNRGTYCYKHFLEWKDRYDRGKKAWGELQKIRMTDQEYLTVIQGQSRPKWRGLRK